MIEELFLSTVESRYLNSIKEIIAPYSKERQKVVIYPAIQAIKQWYATYKAHKADTSGLYQQYIDFVNFSDNYQYRELWAIISVYQLIETESSAWNPVLYRNQYEALATSSLKRLLANRMNKILSSPEDYSYPKSLVDLIYFRTSDLT